MLHHPTNIDSEQASESKTYDPNHNKIMTKYFLSIRKHDLKWLGRECMHPFWNHYDCEIVETTVDRKKFRMLAGNCEKNYSQKPAFHGGNCKRTVTRNFVSGIWLIGYNKTKILADWGNRFFGHVTEKRFGYTRLYSNITLEKWHFKVDNELWKKTFFHERSLLSNFAGDNFYVISILMLQIMNTTNLLK